MLYLTLIYGYKKTYKFTGGGVRTDPENKAVLFKRYEKQEITLGCFIFRKVPIVHIEAIRMKYPFCCST